MKIILIKIKIIMILKKFIKELMLIIVLNIVKIVLVLARPVKINLTV
jgi:hypothetical protein